MDKNLNYDKDLLEIANEIYKEIHNQLHMKIYREEVQYCAILLAGNRYYNDNKNYESDINNVDLYVNLMLRKIFDSFKIDFFWIRNLKTIYHCILLLL